MTVVGIIPARFLCLTAHLVITITIFLDRKVNLESCLPTDYTQEQYDAKDSTFIAALSLSLIFFVFEFIGFFGGITMFAYTHSMLSILVHAAGTGACSFFLFDTYPCDSYWAIFAASSALPALSEACAMVAVLKFQK